MDEAAQNAPAPAPDLRSLLAAKLGIPADELRRVSTESAEKALEHLASLEADELTGLPLRRSGEKALRREVSRASRVEDGAGRMAIAYVDVDDLKKSNDTGGHEAGDRLIRSVAEALTARLRAYDVAVRWGGDEFVCALFGVTPAAAARVFDDVGRDVARRCGGSISVGIAHFQKGDNLETLLERADGLMYKAKQAHHVGRGVG